MYLNATCNGLKGLRRERIPFMRRINTTWQMKWCFKSKQSCSSDSHPTRVCMCVTYMRSRAAGAVGSLKAAAHLPVSAACRDYRLTLMWAHHPAAELQSTAQRSLGRLCCLSLYLPLSHWCTFSVRISASQNQRSLHRMCASCSCGLQMLMWNFPHRFPKWCFKIM